MDNASCQIVKWRHNLTLKMMNKLNLLIPLWKAITALTKCMYEILGSRTNNIVGEFAEHLVADALGGTLAAPSQKDYDMTLPDGRTVQVKARKLTGKYKYSETLSDIHSWNFNVLIIVLFNDDGTLNKVMEIDSALAKTFAHKRPGTSNTDIITLSKKFLDATIDITSMFSKYHLK